MTPNNEVRELSFDEIDMVNGAGLSWNEIRKFLVGIADEVATAIGDFFDKDDV